MDVEVGGRTKALYQRDSAGVDCGAFQACLFEQKSRDDAMDDAQHRREQLGMGGEQNTQRRRRDCMPC